MGKSSKSIVVRFLSLLFAAILVSTVMANPITVEAKVKKKTLKTFSSLSNDDPIYLDSIAHVVKPGHYRFKIKKRKNSGAFGIIRFMAPKEKAYSFTVTKVHANKKKTYANGYFHILQKRMEPDGYLYSERIADSGLFGSKNTGLARKKRSVDIACYQNTVMYVEFYVSASRSNYVQFDFTIK
ncbi:hypothetical protein [Butyrivibrio sp. VCD2006]|uniref:hypothetical protein n=1 Tax=Butyrivibrio sp. VCD2006 TaxID=1280664 RepID=UPI00041E90E4|nr:hypothetical protein [Butyrivibrio sp. VCD2006]